MLYINRAYLSSLMALLYPLQSGRLALRCTPGGPAGLGVEALGAGQEDSRREARRRGRAALRAGPEPLARPGSHAICNDTLVRLLLACRPPLQGGAAHGTRVPEGRRPAGRLPAARR